MDWSWLLLLACPLMMIFMMFGMRGGHNHNSKSNEQAALRLQTELEQLKVENEKLRRDSKDLAK
ncbi:DUF2933 domain-containing protein [Brevibacillus laterosporus]|uniref:DUF2933 domain-containing protein n=1 Tax=Brevibacillus laterosporus TaxID=1465 RepID=A0A502HS31_BRELA|nr:DUF2933 domain-containing protein [Brevibacillus laterosporus]QDX94088.1 DUF2933 domain-containing protein [Brevibacillus laterosporus]TPG75988.1 DUF2933 domain-containing protein [Brevibacillus laterosporus]